MNEAEMNMSSTTGDTPSRDSGIAEILELDACGFLAAPGETREDYLRRVEKLKSDCGAVTNLPPDGKQLSQLVEFPVGQIEPLAHDIMDEAAEKTVPLFGFRADWAPAYFPQKGLGFLWGGCTVETENGVPIFFLRKSFSKRRKWFIYGRDELLAHELCHSVRTPLKDDDYEEHFAYMTSTNAFRRKAGNCFRSEWDAIFFLVPLFLLLLMQVLIFSGVLHIPIYPFWILIFAYPAYMVYRNIPDGVAFRRSYRKLQQAGFSNPNAALFRMISHEIHAISKLDGTDLEEYFRKRGASELRWQIILARFRTAPQTDN